MLNNCNDLFKEEISIIDPVIIISLSELTLRFISKNYYKEELAMEDSFGKLFTINIGAKDYKFIPALHIPRKNSKAEKAYFPEQTNRLGKIKSEGGLLCR
jgi:hypothetical protein